jgi:Phage regulatory protein CII (CP76)
LINSAPTNDIASILNRVVEAKTDYDKRLLAQQLGTNYRSLMYWLRGERPVPAHLLPQMCVLLDNCEVLDFLESQAGRVAFKLPDPNLTLEKELVAISNLIREVGEALESVAETLADGVVEENELKATIPKLEGVISAVRVLKIRPGRTLQKEKEKDKELI